MVKETSRKSSILGPDGLPVEISMLTGEIAAPEMYGQRALDYIVETPGLNPRRLSEIMLQANHGLARPYLRLAIEMEERYLHYASQLQTRRLALDSVNVCVEAPEGCNAKAAELLESVIEEPFFADMVQDLLDGIGKGYSVVEPVWEYENGALRPVKYQHRDPRYFRYDIVDLRDLHLLDPAGMPGLPIEAPYFIKHEPKIRAGIPLRTGLARSAAWAYMVQSFTLQDWSAFAQIYGIPFRVGKYHPSATADDRKALLTAVRAIANDAAGIIPSGMEIEFHEVKGTQGHAVFGSLIDYMDRKISMAVLGQTMTAEDGSSRAQAQVHNEVRHDILKADARQLRATINRDLARFIVAMNFGPQEVYPQIAFDVAEPEDITALAGALAVTVPLGLKVSQNEVREKMGLSDPDDDDELLTPPPVNTPPKAKVYSPPSPLVAPETMAARGVLCACGCGKPADQVARFAAAPATQPDVVDAIGEDEAANWEAQVEPILQQVEAELEKAASYEDFLKRLDKLAGTLQLDLITKRLMISAMKARGFGQGSGPKGRLDG